jgi:hypothetical protein
MLKSWDIKYPKTNKFIALKSLTYYDSIDFDIPVKLTNDHKLNWKAVDKRLQNILKFPDKKYLELPI